MPNIHLLQALLPLLWIGLFLILIIYVGGPVMIRMTLKQAAEPEVIPFPLDHPSLPTEVARAFHTVTEQLRPEGFEPVAALALPRQMANVKAILLLLANRKARDIALATTIYGAAPGATPTLVAYVEFVSHFRDGTVVATNNTATAGVFGPRPTHTMGRFPWVQDVRRLYELHRALVARHGTGDKRLRLDEEFHGDACAAMARSLIEELEAQIPTGYLYLSPEEKVYRATWKGAFLMTWKLLWPMKAIRQKQRERQARRLMAQLDGEMV
jgi:hypothetical protein